MKTPTPRSEDQSMRLVVTEIREPLGIGLGQILARNTDAQVVKITVTSKDWHLFAEAGVGIGDTVLFNAETRTWRRA
jgi:hypothetical protein